MSTACDGQNDDAVYKHRCAISADVLRLVQHLIEECILMYMDREECVNCLSTCADLTAALTRVVWDELEKLNADFFKAYYMQRSKILLVADPHPPQQQRQSCEHRCRLSNARSRMSMDDDDDDENGG
ncbi:hypothetical protein KP509_06G074400 [Ceratopteris richardii]|uniref:Uncharacterized protein n=1 Tax=Ceratopteris richardii TaxID=49495 RepID=A0A8T2UQ45_CERRI|nr:hypothetical protein KP509_06G074400 [Ceratopteris richardii]